MHLTSIHLNMKKIESLRKYAFGKNGTPISSLIGSQTGECASTGPQSKAVAIAARSGSQIIYDNSTVILPTNTQHIVVCNLPG